ncbi:MAG: aminodeoxychorismate/anthranilate synthase component II [Haliscomenobacter sp.]|nr:aminodeoxychorismate/anthranilate synthase component II [Haliscomenobacter sp.]MBK8653289.1 aminodeoxychorismate/anthranilate synthase component II [Haliscomenobacter sp.]
MHILVLDNYDSFTYNLVQYLQELLGHKVDVFRNDAISLEAVERYDVIVLSPGPGLPSEAGIMPDLLQRYAAEKVILGVCLGHQAIGEAFGGVLQNLTQVYHGISTPIFCDPASSVLFEELPAEWEAGRYHSWVVNKESVPDCLQVTAWDAQGEVMAFRHREHDVFGVQFHPESIMTPLGKAMLNNFLEYASRTVDEKSRVARALTS